MSLTFSLKDDAFSLSKMKLPSRYFHFKQQKENFVKLLTIGEGLFPKDKIHYRFTLDKSHLVLTTESASKYNACENNDLITTHTHISLANHSNIEYLTDENILFANSHYLQCFSLHADEQSHFFYSDILSKGRSYENYDFTGYGARNTFYINGKLEYIEKFHLSQNELKKYLHDYKSEGQLFAKAYIKSPNSTLLEQKLLTAGVNSFYWSWQKKIAIVVIIESQMQELKQKIEQIYDIYRATRDKKTFHLSKG